MRSHVGPGILFHGFTGPFVARLLIQTRYVSQLIRVIGRHNELIVVPFGEPLARWPVTDEKFPRIEHVGEKGEHEIPFKGEQIAKQFGQGAHRGARPRTGNGEPVFDVLVLPPTFDLVKKYARIDRGVTVTDENDPPIPVHVIRFLHKIRQLIQQPRLTVCMYGMDDG